MPTLVAPVSSGPAAGGANGSTQGNSQVSTTERGSIFFGGSQPEKDQAGGPLRTDEQRVYERAMRQSKNGSMDVIAVGLGTSESPGDVLGVLAAGAGGITEGQSQGPGQPDGVRQGPSDEGGTSGVGAAGQGERGQATPDQPPAAEASGGRPASPAKPPSSTDRPPEAHGVGQAQPGEAAHAHAHAHAPEQKQEGNNVSVEPGSSEAKKLYENRMADIATLGSKIKALEGVVRIQPQNAEGVSALVSARTHLETLQQDVAQLRYDSLTTQELTEQAHERVAAALEARFQSHSGLKGIMERFYKNNPARREIARMYASLKAEGADRGILQKAIKKGSDKSPGQEGDMGLILRRIRWEKGSGWKRLPFGIGILFKNNSTQESAIAQEQLRALTGQLTEDEMKGYNKSLARLLMSVVVFILSITLPTAKDIAIEATNDATKGV